MRIEEFSSPTLHRKAQAGSVITELHPDQQKRMRRRESFRFSHALVGQNLIDLAEVKRLTEKMLREKRSSQVVARIGKRGLSFEDTLEAFDALQSAEATDTWIRLTRVDEVTEKFRSVVDRFIDDLSGLYERNLRSEVMRVFVTLFISSPHEVTPYHMDHTWNFLLQLSGTKVVHLWDANDPRVLRPEDQERWYAGDVTSLQQNPAVPGIAYHLEPGYGVHHPVNAPHMVENGGDISISLSLGLCLHEANRRAKVCQMNHLLRQWGVKPKPLDQSAMRDHLKAALVDGFSKRNSNAFDDVVFSGYRRMQAVSNMLRRPSFSHSR